MAVKKATKPAGELDSMSVADLKKSGAALGIDGASKMTKADLISAIGELQAANRDAAKKEKEDRRAAKDAAREERRARFMQTQEKISKARLKQKVGKTLTVLVDSIDNDKAVARSAADAPEIDGTVIITGSAAAKLKPGDFATVKITRAGAHDLHGIIV